MIRLLSVLVVATVARSAGATPPAASAANHGNLVQKFDTTLKGVACLPQWDDGLSEMSYYRAVDSIYGARREYTRVVLINRQWMSEARGVKAEPDAPDAVPVFKMTISEEIPTQNYNYRYLITLFLKRPTLDPFKMVLSSQDWCGTTFKHLRWTDGEAKLNSFSYFGREGDQSWSVDGSAVPAEALLLIARDVASTNQPRDVVVLLSLRSNHAVEPMVRPASLTPGPVTSVTVSAGTFKARRVDVEWDGPLTGFVVEAAPPHRLLRYRMGAVRGELVHVERREYWDRSKPSAFYPTSEAP